MSKIHNVVVEIHRPTEAYPGQVAEGRYTFENLKTAKTLGLTVPRGLLDRADEVIE